MISTGVSVPYSDEYRELRSNPTTLETLASLTDGQVVDLEDHARRPDRPAADASTRSTTSAATPA